MNDDNNEARRTYTHRACGTKTALPEPVFELYQREPHLFLELDCAHCDDKFSAADFTWTELGAVVKRDPPPPPAPAVHGDNDL